MKYPELVLFKLEACPFCRKVVSVVDELGLKVDCKDLDEDEGNRSQLLADTGRQTVPCLYIDGKPMFESDDIIEWLRQNQGQLERQG